jgi:pyruvate formate lyase activating enzyme
MEYFLDYLDSRKGWLEGICISGGEPLLHDDLEMLLVLIKERDLLVKLDTNGSFPDRLEALIQKKLIDRIAMDIKAPLERYAEVAGAVVKKEDILRGIDILRNSGLKHIFRCTVVPGLVGSEDVEKISLLIKGAEVFQLQQFVPLNPLDRSFLKKKPYSKEEILQFAKIAEPHFSEVRVEGV